MSIEKIGLNNTPIIAENKKQQTLEVQLSGMFRTKKSQMPENTEKWLKPFEELDCSDFSKVGGKSISSDYKVIYDKNGNKIRSFLKGDDGSISCISDFDPATDLPIKNYWLQKLKL